VTDRPVIAARLREIASLLRLHGDSKFKVRAFERGARAIEATGEPLDSLILERRLTDLPNIGFALANQIEEIWRTGSSELLETLRAGLPSGVIELSSIAGIGLHDLRTLSTDLGIASVADLRAAAEAGRLATAKGFGAKREARILEAIRRYETRAPEILLADGLRLGESLVLELARSPRITRAELAGCLRRSKELSREIEIVLTADDPQTALDEAMRHPRFASVESRTGTDARLRMPDGTRVCLHACRPSQHAATLVRATGSHEHVTQLCALAQRRSVHVDDAADERDLYTRLGLHFVPPELREDIGEIEVASCIGDPFDLVREEDVRGFVHCHTNWSDGKASIEEMAEAVAARGASFLTITDHSKTAHYAGGLDVERLQRQWDEIDAVQERVRVRILKGTEADILADGALDWPDDILERFDVVIASIHNRYRQDEQSMTKRLLRAMRHPIFKIWGHPLGRLIKSRPPVPCRVEEVLDALAESRGAIEINGDPRRLDIEPR
jgi:DNA polymerase (family 10)